MKSSPGVRLREGKGRDHSSWEASEKTRLRCQGHLPPTHLRLWDRMQRTVFSGLPEDLLKLAFLLGQNIKDGISGGQMATGCLFLVGIEVRSEKRIFFENTFSGLPKAMGQMLIGSSQDSCQDLSPAGWGVFLAPHQALEGG